MKSKLQTLHTGQRFKSKFLVVLKLCYANRNTFLSQVSFEGFPRVYKKYQDLSANLWNMQRQPPGVISAFRRHHHKMVKHTQTIRRQKPFDHFVRLELKELIKKAFGEISQNLEETMCWGLFLIKLQAVDLQVYF